jgi:hypothetical protein
LKHPPGITAGNPQQFISLRLFRISEQKQFCEANEKNKTPVQPDGCTGFAMALLGAPPGITAGNPHEHHELTPY